MRCREDFYEGFRNDDKLWMLTRNVEMRHVVGEMIAIAKDATPWADGEVKGETALRMIAARMHPRLHHALADGVAVKELRKMSNRIRHAEVPFLTRQSGLD